MRISVERASVQGAHGPLLTATSLEVSTGEVAIVSGDTGHTALGLVLAGRLSPGSGVAGWRATPHAAPDHRALRTRVALIDAPGVSEPDDGLRLRDVVAEELAHARTAAGRRAVTRWLVNQQLTEHADTRMDNLPASVRISALVELVTARASTRVLVLDQPDRHLSEPAGWLPLALRHARHGFAFIVLCRPNTAALLPFPAARIGSTAQPEPTDLRLTDASRTTATGVPADAESDSR
ncbi:hypothetical protein EV191_1114 [Tamaricihabitans halophyticus]|uniref:ABC transporter family protein n=1 Tax=Tamaricihabitans halophyticus TaxID=1262583 RepID=A0A4R2QFA1_9PSEU|nr:ABC transporter ATP-binding protein [Tamaricihabitans halophyticus]TCP47800.1 hypothetical protein EV191_1114 [Tamaricihabitans halophyticus]